MTNIYKEKARKLLRKVDFAKSEQAVLDNSEVYWNYLLALKRLGVIEDIQKFHKEIRGD